MILDVGCGKQKISPDAVGIDVSADSAADVHWNLDHFPWPLDAGRFSEIHMSHVIEHLEDPLRAMAEIHRVSQNGARVRIVTPHFSSHNSYVDPTHKRHLAAQSFRYFTGEDFPTFTGAPCRFAIEDVHLTFGGNLILDNAGRFLARMSLPWYERHAAWIFPALDIHCTLRALK